jgi:hypothetical protein
MSTIPPPTPPPDPPANLPPPTPPPAADPDAALKTRKLELEIRQLEQATSKKNWILEVLQPMAPSVTAVVAIVALVWTVNSGLQQLRQTQNAQDQDRFDKALSRLGSSSVSERLTGAAGLSLFLTRDQQNRHAATLRFLASALITEKDSSVRQTILDTFSHMDPIVVKQDARDDALRALLDLNRSALQVVIREQEPFSSTPQSRDPDFASKLEGLRASSKAIVFLVKDGTREHNFSGIDCTDCNFADGTNAIDLSNSSFKQTILVDAKFAGATLTGSSFEDANLAGTKFEGANLRNTRFTGAAHNSYSVRQFQANGDRPRSPDFACADMAEADFSGSLFFGLIESNSPNERIAGYPDLFQTNLNGANLEHIGLYALALPRSKASPPFAYAKTITYGTQKAKPRYALMHVIEAKLALPPRSVSTSFRR